MAEDLGVVEATAVAVMEGATVTVGMEMAAVMVITVAAATELAPGRHSRIPLASPMRLGYRALPALAILRVPILETHPEGLAPIAVRA